MVCHCSPRFYKIPIVIDPDGIDPLVRDVEYYLQYIRTVVVFIG